MTARGWVVREGERYRLTDTGRELAKVMMAGLEHGGRFIARATRPETAARATMIVHLLLGAVKLPTAAAVRERGPPEQHPGHPDGRYIQPVRVPWGCAPAGNGR